MKFLKNIATTGLVAATAIGLSVFVQPQQAQAFVIGAGDTLNINGGAGGVRIGGTPVADFTGGSASSGSLLVTNFSTGGFASLIGKAGEVADLSASDVAQGLAGTLNKPFLKLFQGATSDFSTDIFFNLKKITGAGVSPTPGPFDIGYATFLGEFTNASGALLGDGIATMQLFDNVPLPQASSWSMTIVAKNDVPTPALIPGIAAMGMGMLRRKKAQKVAA
jgi:hypothetical protein